MDKIRLIAVAIAFLCCGTALAQKLTAADVAISPNGTASLLLSWEATEVAAGVELYISLPDGIEIEQENEAYKYTKGDLLGGNTSVAMKKMDNGDIQVIIFDITQAVFKSTSGTLISLPLKAGDIKEGTYTGSVTGIKVGNYDGPLSGADPETRTFPDASFTIAVSLTTGLNGINADDLKQGRVYNMRGQKVNRVGQNGVYIVNGKKVIVNRTKYYTK